MKSRNEISDQNARNIRSSRLRSISSESFWRWKKRSSVGEKPMIDTINDVSSIGRSLMMNLGIWICCYLNLFEYLNFIWIWWNLCEEEDWDIWATFELVREECELLGRGCARSWVDEKRLEKKVLSLYSSGVMVYRIMWVRVYLSDGFWVSPMNCQVRGRDDVDWQLSQKTNDTKAGSGVRVQRWKTMHNHWPLHWGNFLSYLILLPLRLVIPLPTFYQYYQLSIKQILANTSN